MPTPRFSSRFLIGSGCCVATLLVTLTGLKKAAPPAKQMQTFATAYLDTLDEAQRDKTTEDFDAPSRVGWHFIPKRERKGLMIGEMNDAQRSAALRLVRAALSEAGYDKAHRIMLLEEVLNEMEAGKGNWKRDPQRYYVTLFGSPTSADDEQPSRWGLSFEGHHLSLNFVCQGNQVLDSTPQFMATNPATVMNDTSTTLGKGTRVLAREEQVAFKLINDLSPAQAKEAIIAEEAPAEIRFAGEAQPEVGEPEGIAWDKLNGKQQSLLKDLINAYIEVAPESVAKDRLNQIESDGWSAIHFAWAGATKPGIGHYYRVRGKRFLIEFVNTQADPAGNPANHIHCVLRDLSGDFDLPL